VFVEVWSPYKFGVLLIKNEICFCFDGASSRGIIIVGFLGFFMC